MKIVITAGGTSEYIDKVRKITNSGTGKLGSMIANELVSNENINEIFYIHTPNAAMPNSSDKINPIEITDTMSLKNTVEDVLSKNNIDWFIHSMAVSDYYVDYVSTVNLISSETNNRSIQDILNAPQFKLDNTSKISSNEDNLIIMLKQTPKIIGLIKEKSPFTKLIGFKLLEDVTKDYLINIAKKLRDKNKCDYVIANDLKDIKNGNHKAFLLDKNDNVIEINGKDNIARKIKEIVK